MKKKTSTILFSLLFLVGLSLLLYPYISNRWNTYKQDQCISAYSEIIVEQAKDGTIDYDAELKKAQDYNANLLPSVLPDSFAIAAADEEADEAYMSCLNLSGDGMMGYVVIPKIDVELPVYHTTTEEVLKKAAGHLEGSSLPVGGEDTHAVISAHRGLPSASLFTDLDQLEEGDSFLLYILDDILCYEVDKISVINPGDTEDLAVEDGKDLVTLMTCTPYGVNSHRLLVRGHRVPYVPDEAGQAENQTKQISWHTNYLLWIMIGLAVVAVFVLVLYLREKKLRRKLENRDEKEEKSR